MGIGGAFVGGEVFPPLALTPAFGLVGTPFALALVVYLLNDPGAVPEPPSAAANAGGVVLVGVTAVTAGPFLRGRVAGRGATAESAG